MAAAARSRAKRGLVSLLVFALDVLAGVVLHVPLDGGADRARDDGAPQLNAMLALGQRGSHKGSRARHVRSPPKLWACKTRYGKRVPPGIRGSGPSRNWLLVPPHRTVAEGSGPSPRPAVLQVFRGDSRGPLFHARGGYLHATRGRMIGKALVMWT